MNYLVLVNKNNRINEQYIKNLNLIEVNDAFGTKVKIEKTAYEAYLKLKDYLKSKDIIIGIDSSYRSIEEQSEIYNSFLIKYGVEYTNTYVALPKTSEHHTGLAIDITLKIDNKYLDDNNDLFVNEEIYLQIHKVLYKFGFILRYPKGKETITGYGYEPWHIRYVGECANEIYKNNMCLEEYLNDTN